ncbi:histidine ammonia-lyase [Vibrio sp. RE88]|uniref:histidine ammonia-lyase n=1 Tax=Vibrio sp. RE88 TaxID=2607610 RepID=UPI0014933E09|nr:histidine ammonia-lyase [Vibrio sp. RE88]NOH62469.1 histidine ammonia-lyase [Vibrio sp. RE88]
MNPSRSLLLSTLTVALLSGCNSDDTNPTSTTASAVNVYSSATNCSVQTGANACQFDKGIYVLSIGPNVSETQRARVQTQINNLASWAHSDVQKQFAQKTLVIGVIEKEPAGSADYETFVLNLAKQVNTSSGIDGIELVYTNNGGGDETLKNTSYQKMLQLYDYYVDEDALTTQGAEVASAYQEFQRLLSLQTGATKLEYDPCNYGNGQLAANTCPAPDDKGDEDPIHTVSKDLNPGALLGSMYEYKVDPSLGTYPGELKPSFTATGDVASQDSNATDNPLNWTHRAFAPLNNFLNSWFFVNKK